MSAKLVRTSPISLACLGTTESIRIGSGGGIVAAHLLRTAPLSLMVCVSR